MSDRNSPDLAAAYSLVTPEDNRRLYRNWATTYDEEFAIRSGYRSAELIAQAFLDAGGKGPVLDAGCGTGLVANHLSTGMIVDGVDISPEMMEQARTKGRYRHLIEADLTNRLPFPNAAYAGLTSSGTFTHGHVGPDVLEELMRVLQPGAVCAIGGNTTFFREADFKKVFDNLVAKKVISTPTIREERIYDSGATPPDGHENDTCFVIVFNRH